MHELVLSPQLATGSFENYLQKIQQLPLLSLEEEQGLALRFREQGDLKAAQTLILSHLRYVARIVRSYAGYGLAPADLMQEGTIGLMKAVKRFDPKIGVRLASFAVHWIKAEMHEFIIRNWRIVRVATTKAQRKLFFNLRSAKKRLGWFGQAEISAVAEDLGVRPEDVIEMEQRLNAHNDVSFDISEEDESVPTLGPASYLAAPNADPVTQLVNVETEGRLAQLREAMKNLSPRDQIILENRWLAAEKMPFKELADRFNVSIERVRQLEVRAIQQLKALLRGEEVAV